MFFGGFSYHGHSMEGTFKSGDILLLETVTLSDVVPGDVVVFDFAKHRHQKIQIVHRVLACTACGLITKGDANPFPDLQIVTSENLIGRVNFMIRNGKVLPVFGGNAGRLRSHSIRLWRRLVAFGRAPYRWLRASGIIRLLWHPSLKRVTLATAQGPAVKYLHAGKTVAVWRPETRTYWCRKPYDLVLESPLLTANHQRVNE